MHNTILNLVTPKAKEQEKGYVEIQYTEGSSEIIQCDSFGLNDELPGFLVLWSELSEEMLCFINSSSIKKITILKDYINDNS